MSDAHLYSRFPGHPAERNQKEILHLHIVFLISRTVAAEITDFDMITFTNQAVPVRRLADISLIPGSIPFSHLPTPTDTQCQGETLSVMSRLISTMQRCPFPTYYQHTWLLLASCLLIVRPSLADINEYKTYHYVASLLDYSAKMEPHSHYYLV